MKPPKKPFPNQLFNPPFTTSTAENSPISSLHTLVSQFLTPPSSPNPHRNPTQDYEISNTHLPISSNQPKPTTKTTFPELIPSTKPQVNFGNTHLPKTKFNSTSYRAKHQKNDLFNNYLLYSSTRPEPITKSSFCDPNLQTSFFGTRSFSADSMERNSISSDAIPVVSKVNPPGEAPKPIDAGSSIRKPISLWPGMYHSPVTNALWEARSKFFERMSNGPTDSPSQSELTTKTPSRSRTSILYKFSTDYILREQYRNPWNEIRMGKLLEDLDALAGTISFKHCSSDDSTTAPLLLVTASVDKMVLKKPIWVDTDLTIVGSVTWVGRSSMEIRLEVTQATEGKSNQSDPLALVANFTFVARGSKTGKSALINQISPETETEKLLWEEAEERNKMRRKKRGEKMRKMDDEETERLNELLSEGRVFCDMPALADRNSILIMDTCHQNSLICQPQQRNIHGRIFGGFLMRRAFELAFATAYAFAGSKPCYVEIDHVDFLKPVDVGNFLRFKSCVLYTELENPAKPLINVEVVAHVTRPELRISEVSNKFYFTFTISSEAIKDGLQIRNVVPATEEEARRVIERMDAESS